MTNKTKIIYGLITIAILSGSVWFGSRISWQSPESVDTTALGAPVEKGVQDQVGQSPVVEPYKEEVTSDTLSLKSGADNVFVRSKEILVTEEKTLNEVIQEIQFWENTISAIQSQLTEAQSEKARLQKVLSDNNITIE
jgi:hypothetical protein